MRVDVRPRKRNAPRPAWKVEEAYGQWLRGRACACGGRNPDCGGKVQRAHGPDPASKGMGTKSRDSVAMPLSARCHELQHRIGWISFGISYLGTRDQTTGGVRAICDEYWRLWKGDKGDLA